MGPRVGLYAGAAAGNGTTVVQPTGLSLDPSVSVKLPGLPPDWLISVTGFQDMPLRQH
jgi:hypothetical protein